MDDLYSLNYRGSLVFGGFCEPFLDRRLFRFLRAARSRLGKKVTIAVYTNGDYFSDSVYEFFSDYNIKAYVTLHEHSEKAHLFKKKFGAKKNVFIRDTMVDDYLTTMGGLVEVKKREMKKVCIHAPFILTVNCDGDIVLCCEDFFAKNRFGNISERKVVDIWNDETFVNLRKKLKKGKSDIPLCRFCFGTKKN